MTQQPATHPAVTGEEHSYDSLHDDPTLQGLGIIYEVVSYVKGSGIPDRVIVRAITNGNSKCAWDAYAHMVSTRTGRAIGHELIPLPQGSSPRRIHIRVF